MSPPAAASPPANARMLKKLLAVVAGMSGDGASRKTRRG